MAVKNTLVIMSDEHASKALGCYGHPFVQTPNLDRLAERGCRFDSAYSNSPICLPARAAFATGRYVHEDGYWDNAHPYDGAVDSWGHLLRDKDVRSVSIGKLHYRNETDDTGFDEQIVPMHIVGGKGDVLGSVRDELPVRHKCRSMSDQIGPGESSYTRYDRDIARLSCDWLKENADSEQGWVLFVGFVAPHFPLIAPQEFYDLYADMDIPMPKAYADAERVSHPWFDAWRKCWIHDRFFDEEKVKIALTSYYGLCSFVDDNIGQILNALDESGVAAETQVIYTSDHGDNMGARGMWGKSNFYEEAAAIPMIMAGPGVKKNSVCRTPVSLVDAAATVVDGMGEEVPADWRGKSLSKIASRTYDDSRVVFSEYHAAGATSGAYMIRQGRYKYCYYVGFAPQLFDLESDPEELNDLASNPEMGTLLRSFERELRRICDPEAVDIKAKNDQEKLVNANGGREVVVERGGFGATPAPGEKVVFK